MEFQHVGTPVPCEVINTPAESSISPKYRTVVIGGVPRGGTTMVAATVEALGVYLGPEQDLREFTFEDQKMHSPHVIDQFERIQENNQSHHVWGWKDPGAIHPLNQIAHMLRNPRVIIVFRDMLASIQGEMRFDRENGIDRPMQALIDNTMERYQTIFTFIERTQLPLLLVSYERAVNQKEQFVDSLIDFIGIEVSSEQKETALERISPTGGYLKW